MKISKSKQELARIISENGGWLSLANMAVYGKISGECYLLCADELPVYDTSVKGFYINARDVVASFKSEPFNNWHQTVLYRKEYFHLYPVQDADGWVEWKGGERPVEFGSLIDVKYRDGHIQLGCIAGNRRYAELYATTYWGSSGGSADIIAYRPHKPERASETGALSADAVSSAKDALMSDSIEGLARKPTIEQLAADYRSAKDYADRKQQEADDAKADAEAKLAELVAAGNALGLVLSVAGPEPELVITDWRDLRVGDIIEYVDGDIKDKIGMTGPVVEFAKDDSDGMPVRLKCNNGPDNGRLGWPRKWRFIRRP